MTHRAKAFVIGGGVVGLCTSIKLAERDFAVTVVDTPPPLGAASWGNIGHIATEQCVPLASWANVCSVPRRLSLWGGPVGLPLQAMNTWLPFGLRMMKAAAHLAAGTQALSNLLQDALPAWRRLDAIWPTSSVLQENGHYVIWESEQTASAGRKSWHQAAKGTATCRDVTNRELQELLGLFPSVALRATKFSNTGKITDLQQLRINLQTRLKNLSGLFWHRKVKCLDSNAGLARIVFEDGEALSPDLIVVCTGASSSSLLGSLGYRIPLVAERGYHVECGASSIDAKTVPMVFEDRSVVINRFNHGLRIAGFVEFAELSRPPDVRKWQKLEQHLSDLGIVQSGAKSRWMGARPTLPDYLPAIGKTHEFSNLLYAFGHQHLGLTLAPITAEKIADIATAQVVAEENKAFCIERFT